jgi:hypothetical protein
VRFVVSKSRSVVAIFLSFSQDGHWPPTKFGHLGTDFCRNSGRVNVTVSRRFLARAARRARKQAVTKSDKQTGRHQVGGGDDWLYGRGGTDLLLGDGGNDHLYGEGGFDQLNGGEGNDHLNGGFDGIADSLTGGSGNDTFVAEYYFDGPGFGVRKNRDQPTDYAAGDQIVELV